MAVLAVCGVLAVAWAGAVEGADVKAEPGFRVESAAPVRQEGIPEGVVRLETVSGVDGVRDWALAFPPAQGDTWAVVIHGHGSHGDQLYTRPDIRRDWLPAFQKRGMGILTPNLRDNAWMSPAAAADLHALLDDIRKRYGARRFIFASGSMGGTSNILYAGLYPEDVAGVVALCPATDLASYHAWCRQRNEGVLKEVADAIEAAYGGPPEKQPDRYRLHSALQNAGRLRMPVYVCHGTADTIIPVSQARKLAGLMGDAGTFAYVEIPGGHHDSPLAACEAGLAWVTGKP